MGFMDTRTFSPRFIYRRSGLMVYDSSDIGDISPGKTVVCGGNNMDAGSAASKFIASKSKLLLFYDENHYE